MSIIETTLLILMVGLFGLYKIRILENENNSLKREIEQLNEALTWKVKQNAYSNR